MMKPGTEYELFVKEIYEAILRYEGIENINIQHDKKIKGSSGVDRQVDIFWEFKIAGVRHKVIVECKDYKTAVPLEKIDAFRSKLMDIGGATGVFISKNGYQSGAIELGKKYGIQLQEIRVPSEEDWKGRIRDIELSLHCRFLNNVHPKIEVDPEWAKINNYTSTSRSGWTDEIFIESASDGSRISLLSLINKLSREDIGTGLNAEFQFEDSYFCIDNDRIKISKINFEYDVIESTDVLKICGDNVIKAIVHDVLEGTTSTVRINGDVIMRK